MWTKHSPCCRGIIPMALAVACWLGTVDARAGEETGWRLRVDFGFFDPAGEGITVDTGLTTVSTDLDGGGGVGVRAEYQMSRRFGVEFGFFSGASVDINVLSGSSSSVEINSFTPFAVGANLHLTPGSRVDLYMGPQLAWVSYSSLEVGAGPGFAGTTISVDTDLGPAAILGLDIPVGERRRWSFQTSLRYFDTRMEGGSGTNSLDGDFDPTVFSLGFGYRF